MSNAGTILPAGSLPPAAELPEGPQTITILGHDESGLLACEYPDGFLRHHDSSDVTDLLSKVTGMMRGRYGWGEVNFTQVPAALEPGASIICTR